MSKNIDEQNRLTAAMARINASRDLATEMPIDVELANYRGAVMRWRGSAAEAEDYLAYLEAA